MKQHLSLESVKIKTGFKVPEDFFAQNKTDIMRQVVFEKQPKKNKFLWLKIAAMFLIFMSLFMFWNHTQDQKNKQLYADIEDYLAMNRSSLYLLIEADFITIDEGLMEALSSEDIEDYLMLNQTNFTN